MLMNLMESKSRLELIRRFVKAYRPELTIIGGVMAEERLVMDCDKYIKFANSLSEDEFVGNYLINITNIEALNLYRKSLKKGLQLDDLIWMLSNKGQKEIKERIKALDCTKKIKIK